MSIRKSQWTNIKGERTEESAKTYKFEERHFHREAKSQKAQLESAHQHGTRKDVKRPMDEKLT
ncbi:hypothetical protein [Alkaliphilus peptidifermentans]|uniref:Uncharacterized protein n=1 Tax=Alkaliphilus peptidifermentans DSM 18978 TaxID=1120976 RepID=A0A1G5I349_9FIRM|nr:hypothetical protein [Alkaliphilus peptidifermentans]SCY69808.1 hypothetical protein SAMN03080606_02201 [Alkaliphilus peptidifermentans DSM 18978]